VGILVGTSMIVIIPEGMAAVAPHGGHSHTKRSLDFGLSRAILSGNPSGPGGRGELPSVRTWNGGEGDGAEVLMEPAIIDAREADDDAVKEMGPENGSDNGSMHETEPENERSAKDEEESEIPTFFIGFSLITGFILMFLIDRLPRHATDHMRPPPGPVEISLDNLVGGSDPGPLSDEEAAGFLGSLAPTPRQSRSLAVTTGLVIHAAADGIAMGASSSTSNVRLGFIVFIAILIHKAPAAFGLTSVLLKQGLSKRAARGHLLIFSLAAPAGAIGTWLLIAILGGGRMVGDSGRWWTGMLLLFSAGTFL
jgi:solute carrier family 39 (zinc transporter), member 9